MSVCVCVLIWTKYNPRWCWKCTFICLHSSKPPFLKHKMGFGTWGWQMNTTRAKIFQENHVVFQTRRLWWPNKRAINQCWGMEKVMHWVNQSISFSPRQSFCNCAASVNTAASDSASSLLPLPSFLSCCHPHLPVISTPPILLVPFPSDLSLVSCLSTLLPFFFSCLLYYLSKPLQSYCVVIFSPLFSSPAYACDDLRCGCLVTLHTRWGGLVNFQDIDEVSGVSGSGAQPSAWFCLCFVPHFAHQLPRTVGHWIWLWDLTTDL